MSYTCAHGRGSHKMVRLITSHHTPVGFFVPFNSSLAQITMSTAGVVCDRVPHWHFSHLHFRQNGLTLSLSELHFRYEQLPTSDYLKTQEIYSCEDHVGTDGFFWDGCNTEVKNEDRMTNSIGQLVLTIIIGSLE